MDLVFDESSFNMLFIFNEIQQETDEVVLKSLKMVSKELISNFMDAIVEFEKWLRIGKSDISFVDAASDQAWLMYRVCFNNEMKEQLVFAVKDIPDKKEFTIVCSTVKEVNGIAYKLNK